MRSVIIPDVLNVCPSKRPIEFFQSMAGTSRQPYCQCNVYALRRYGNYGRRSPASVDGLICLMAGLKSGTGSKQHFDKANAPSGGAGEVISLC